LALRAAEGKDNLLTRSSAARASICGSAFVQTYPNRPVKLLIGALPGGALSTGRLISTLGGSTVAACFRSQSPLEYEFATDTLQFLLTHSGLHHAPIHWEA